MPGVPAAEYAFDSRAVAISITFVKFPQWC